MRASLQTNSGGCTLGGRPWAPGSRQAALHACVVHAEYGGGVLPGFMTFVETLGGVSFVKMVTANMQKVTS